MYQQAVQIEKEVTDLNKNKQAPLPHTHTHTFPFLPFYYEPEKTDASAVSSMLSLPVVPVYVLIWGWGRSRMANVPVQKGSVLDNRREDKGSKAQAGRVEDEDKKQRHWQHVGGACRCTYNP